MSNSASTPLISVIIVTWNSAAYLPHCLDCLEAQSFKDFEVIAVDNASNDGTLQVLHSRSDSFNVRIDSLDKNRGFAVANNTGAGLARGKWLALLNPDAFPEPDWLAALYEAAERFAGFSFFASRQLQANCLEKLDGAGDVFHVSGLAWRRFLNGPADRLGLDAGEVFSPCGAAALYLRSAFLKVGGFDEDFFSYHEDVDLGFRLRLAGFRSMYVPGAVVKHIGSASTGKRSTFAIYHGHRNLVWTYVKDMPGSLFWLFLPGHVLMNVIFLIYFSCTGHAGAIWRAKWDALRGLGLMVRKRREIQQNRSESTIHLYRQMDRNWLSPLATRMSQNRSSRAA